VATYTPTAGSPLTFHLLVDPPTRDTRQTISERQVPGSTTTIVDVIGRAVTKVLGRGRFDSFTIFKTFEVQVGTSGVLIYSEEGAGVNVVFVAIQRTRVTKADVHIANVEFWLV
jgi:hypothetical protein